MREVMVAMIIALTFTTHAKADWDCIKISDNLTICTDTVTGEETEIWTY